MSGPAVRGPRRDVSLRRRLGIMLVAAGVLGVVLVGWGAWALGVVDDRGLLITETYFDAITEAEAGYLTLVDAESAFAGYLLTGAPATLVPLERLEVPAPTDGPGARLREVLGADHPVIEAQQRSQRAIERWYEEFVVPTGDVVRSSGVDAVAAEDVARGEELFEEVRTSTDSYLRLLRAERSLAMDDLRQSGAVLDVFVGLVVVASVVVAAAVWVLTRRWVTGPLATLATDARTVADGDVGHRVRVTGPGEVGAVARDVEQMRVRLVRLIEDSRRARTELEASHRRLEEQAEDLRRSNRDLEEFAYVASHDLQEPLRKVASFTQLLGRRYEGRLDQRADRYIAFAVDGARRMQRLVNDLLEFSRVGRSGGPPTDVDLAAVLDGALEELAGPLEAAGAIVVGQDLPVVRGRRTLLQQLMVNLVDNAVKFRHPDRAPRVRLGARRVGDSWELFCADNGIGIDPEHAGDAFVIFQRLHTAEPHEGTGIGLALCKRIVEYHGGQMWVDTGVETGAVVRWTLPATADQDTSAGTTSEARPAGRAADPAEPADPEGSTGSTGSPGMR